MFFHLEVRFSAPKTPLFAKVELKLKDEQPSFNFSSMRFGKCKQGAPRSHLSSEKTTHPSFH
jgi:hypothetical protein